MFNSTPQKIIFKAQNEYVWEVHEKPKPSSNFLPEWWKKLPIYSNDEHKFNLNPHPTVTVKRCGPMLDTLTTGYIIPLWTDVFVKQENDFPYVQWLNSTEVFNTWSLEQSSNFEVPENFNKLPFKFLHGWTIKTPKGWSCMFTHPFGYPNSPFRTITGIVDTDVYDVDINVPFFIKNGFEGIVEKGTPMVQIIPFKRQNWVAEYEQKAPNEHKYDVEKLWTKMVGSYSRHIRVPKSYK